MSYAIQLERKPNYVHAIGSGVLSEENARRFLFEAYRAAVESGCSSLLLEMKFSGELPLGKIYGVISERSMDGALLRQIAYVDGNTQHVPDAAEFATLVAVNRGVNVQLFRSLAEAQRWLG